MAVLTGPTDDALLLAQFTFRCDFAKKTRSSRRRIGGVRVYVIGWRDSLLSGFSCQVPIRAHESRRAIHRYRDRSGVPNQQQKQWTVYLTVHGLWVVGWLARWPTDSAKLSPLHRFVIDCPQLDHRPLAQYESCYYKFDGLLG